ncbi:M23 family metallopeptidase [Marinobacter salicampi]|uniref:M23 family metallopeptidase n=1 Tax=Marinobacter salicampi TaxID=435907 RepID=UPI00140A85DE|nr:M23 family metallopeptidase [Marinobacter salicampi]
MKGSVFTIGLMALLACFQAQADTLTLDGPLSQGSLVRGQAAAGSEVRLNDEPVRTTEDGRFVIGFGRTAELSQRLVIITPEGQREIRELQLQERDYDVQRIEGVPARTVTPSEESLERIRREADQVRLVRSEDSDLTGFLGEFVWPAEGRISGVYGSQRVYNGEPRSPHFGIDIAAPRGAPVIAPADGMITLAAPDLFYSGGTLIIDHGHGVSSTFLHLSEFEVSLGAEVRQGDLIARVGSSGRSTGPHLDWRVNWFDVRVDPTLIAPGQKGGHTPVLAFPVK